MLRIRLSSPSADKPCNYFFFLFFFFWENQRCGLPFSFSLLSNWHCQQGIGLKGTEALLSSCSFVLGSGHGIRVRLHFLKNILFVLSPMSSLLNALKDILYYSKMFQALRSPPRYQGKKNRGANERGEEKKEEG